MAIHANALPSDYELGEYRLVSVLGEGGFGITYQAEDCNLNCPVAIKEYLPTQLAKRLEDGTVVSLSATHAPYFGDWKRRFLDEARVLARFRHPSIVRVLRFFEGNGTAYLVMEMEQGTTLEHYLKQLNRPPSQQELDAIIGPVLDGLGVVHAAGYLHRDIKPQNIIIRPDGSPVLIDFGAARLEVTGRSRTLTSVYTPGYAAPEQYAEHGRLGPWTDLYALGAVLYRAVTGIKPMESLSRMMMVDDPSPRAVDAAKGSYRADFLAGIDAALRIRPEERPQSVEDWRRWLVAPPATPSPTETAHDAASAAGDTADMETVVALPPVWPEDAESPVASPPLHSVTAVSSPQPPQPITAPPPPPEPPARPARGSRKVLWLSGAGGIAGLVALGVWLALPGPVPKPEPIASPPVVRPTPAESPTPAQMPKPAPTPAEASLSRTLSIVPPAETQPGVFQDCADCPEMVELPAGNFVMGSPSSDKHHKDREEPQRTVTIARPFAIGRTHITRQQFKAFAEDTGYSSGCQIYRKNGWGFDSKANWQSPGFPQDDNHPAICVSWTEAQAYAEWLSHKTGHTYRLPTEAEWEYAARAGSSEILPWGTESSCAYANVADQATHAANSYLISSGCNDGFAYTAPVGSFKPNAFGLYDMIGNAAQWVEDCWHPTYKGAPTDGSAWGDGKCTRRVVRGSAWGDGPEDLRVAARYNESAVDHEAGVGFRLVRVPGP